MDRIIIRGEPVGPLQRISIIKDNAQIGCIGVQFDDLTEVVFDLLQKYELTHIDLSGVRIYMQGIEKMIKEAGIRDYAITNLHFRYV